MSDDIYTTWLAFPEGEVAISLDAMKWMHAIGRHYRANPMCSECREDMRLAAEGLTPTSSITDEP